MVRRFLHLQVVLVAFGVVAVALILVLGVIAAPAAAANQNCELVARPAATFQVADGAQTVKIEIDLAANSADTIERIRSVALFQAATRNFGPAALAELAARFDSLVEWYDFLDHPCAQALPYEGPYTNVPESAEAPYGFGGINPSTDLAAVIRFSGPDGETVQVARVVDDGPALAHSGSESFVLVYFGVGLLAFGAAALGTRRRINGPKSAIREVSL